MSGQTPLLGEKLADLRTARGLTQQQLAFSAGVSLSTVSKLEEGAVTKPSARILLKITGVLKYNLDDLLSAEPLPAHLRARPKLSSTVDHQKAPIKFVYFDVGGVMAHTESLVLHHLSAAIGRPLNQVRAFYYQYIGLVDRGKITIADFTVLLILKLNVPFKGDVRNELFRDWTEYQEPNPGAHVFAAEVAKSYPIGLLTNISKGRLDNMFKRGLVPKLPYKVKVQSWQYGLAKPELEFYAIAAKLAKTDPKNILLIDDRKENVLGARAAGWQATWFKEVKIEESIARIRREYF